MCESAGRTTHRESQRASVPRAQPPAKKYPDPVVTLPQGSIILPSDAGLVTAGSTAETLGAGNADGTWGRVTAALGRALSSPAGHLGSGGERREHVPAARAVDVIPAVRAALPAATTAKETLDAGGASATKKAAARAATQAAPVTAPSVAPVAKPAPVATPMARAAGSSSTAPAAPAIERGLSEVDIKKARSIREILKRAKEFERKIRSDKVYQYEERVLAQLAYRLGQNWGTNKREAARQACGEVVRLLGEVEANALMPRFLRQG